MMQQVSAHHLRRLACLYVRQSTLQQVIENDEALLRATRLRAACLGIANAFCLLGAANDPQATKLVPEATFDLIVSRRGPKFSANLVRTLCKEAIVVQEVVSNLDGPKFF